MPSRSRERRAMAERTIRFGWWKNQYEIVHHDAVFSLPRFQTLQHAGWSDPQGGGERSEPHHTLRHALHRHGHTRYVSNRHRIGPFVMVGFAALTATLLRYTAAPYPVTPAKAGAPPWRRSISGKRDPGFRRDDGVESRSSTSGEVDRDSRGNHAASCNARDVPPCKPHPSGAGTSAGTMLRAPHRQYTGIGRWISRAVIPSGRSRTG